MFSVQGMYEPDEEDADEEALDITYGNSRDKRKDLKQFNIDLAVNQTGVPVVGAIMDGNASELDWNPELVNEFCDWTDTDAPLITMGIQGHAFWFPDFNTLASAPRNLMGSVSM